MSTVRLDKYLALSGERTRSEAVRLIRTGQVMLRGQIVRDPTAKVEVDDAVLLAGQSVANSRWQYYLFYKPAGVLTAARDSHAQTVMDLLPESFSRRKVLPIGRLDKDTTGLLLLTNDGALAHRLLDPKRHVWKRYVACVAGQLTQADVRAFAQGIQLSDFIAKPAKLCLLTIGDETSTAAIEVREGKFHQVKRMFAACGHEVLTLHRAAFGPLELPQDIQPGEYRSLTMEQLEALRLVVRKEGESHAE